VGPLGVLLPTCLTLTQPESTPTFVQQPTRLAQQTQDFSFLCSFLVYTVVDKPTIWIVSVWFPLHKCTDLEK